MVCNRLWTLCVAIAFAWAVPAFANPAENLFDAATRGDVPAVSTLLANGADVNSKNQYRQTALIFASQNNHLDVARILLAKGADVNARDNNGWTSLMYVSQRKDLDFVQALLNMGADVNFKGKYGDTALMLASQFGNANVVQALLARGATVNAKSNNGGTALDGTASGYDDVRKLLLQAGAVDVKSDPSWKGVWKGTLGKQGVTACFQIDDEHFFRFGLYYYDKYRQPIRLNIGDDEAKAGAKLILDEPRDVDYNTTGSWELATSAKDTLAGTWAGNGKQFALSLVRVPIANRDASNDPCGSDEFNSGRKMTHLVTSTDKLNGSQYRVITVKNEGIASFELIGSDRNTRSINEQLRADLESEINEAFNCTSYVLGARGEQGDYGSVRKPIFLTDHWVSAETHSENFCGGAHPNADVAYKTWNRETGREEDIWTWFNASGAKVTQHPKVEQMEAWNEIQIMPKLRAQIARRWGKGGDENCDNIGENEDFWRISIDNGGLNFTPELPHVIFACTDTGIGALSTSDQIFQPMNLCQVSTVSRLCSSAGY